MRKLILLFLILAFCSPIIAEDVIITFIDSTMIEDASIVSSDPDANGGRIKAAGSMDRTALVIGPNYSTVYETVFRILNFKDSIDSHSGMIIDSAKLGLRVYAGYIGASEHEYIRTIGFTSSRTWVEGNCDWCTATNCEVSWDSTRTGAATCGSPLAWNSSGATGVGDTMGTYVGKPEDSLYFTETENPWGTQVFVYVDTVVMNAWKDNADNNQGFLLKCTSGSTVQSMIYFYGSETRLTGRLDSIPVFQVFGHTGGAPPEGDNGRRRRIGP